MITGFKPADRYAADHIRRALMAFPGVFSGIGEFTIHNDLEIPFAAGDEDPQYLVQIKELFHRDPKTPII
jgi:hypothetical protein